MDTHRNILHEDGAMKMPSIKNHIRPCEWASLFQLPVTVPGVF